MALLLKCKVPSSVRGSYFLHNISVQEKTVANSQTAQGYNPVSVMLSTDELKDQEALQFCCVTSLLPAIKES